MEEIWKDINEYNGIYQISNFGRIKRLKDKYHIKDKILKPFITETGYLRISLCNKNIKKTYRVHRLVAEAFIPNLNNLPCINHKDENKQNNNVNNLEWCTHQYNNTYGTFIERRSKSRGVSVTQYDLQGNIIKEWESIISAKKALNVYNIDRCCKGKQHTAKGYMWKYTNK